MRLATWPNVASLLQRYGIRFVVVEPLPKAKIDGAAFWLDQNTPAIAFSLRYDYIGSFWFAVIRELFHPGRENRTSRISLSCHIS